MQQLYPQAQVSAFLYKHEIDGLDSQVDNVRFPIGSFIKTFAYSGEFTGTNLDDITLKVTVHCDGDPVTILDTTLDVINTKESFVFVVPNKSLVFGSVKILIVLNGGTITAGTFVGLFDYTVIPLLNIITQPAE